MRAKRKDLDYLVIAGMFVSGLYVTITGLVTDVLGLHQFFLHRYAGYAGAALIGLHLVLNWGRIRAYLRLRFGRLPGREPPAPLGRAPPLGRRGFLVAALGAAGGFVLGRLIPSQRWVETPEQVAGDRLRGDLGALYHRWSKPGAALGLGAVLNWGGQTERTKRYAGAELIPLPDPHGYGGLSLEEAVERRRSQRDYAAEPLSLVDLSRLLHAAQGITDPRRGFRAAPSAGALYPIELYPVVHDVAGLEPGLYHYAVADHALEQLRVGDLRMAMVVAGIGQEMLGQAQACFLISAIFQRTRWKYRERTYRYVLLEAGHVGQNLYLAATSMGLGACAIGAFLDDHVNDLVGLDGEQEAVVYIISSGKV